MKNIFVYADWIGMREPTRVGTLTSDLIRGKEIFSFSYYKKWLESDYGLLLDPDLLLYAGPQYLREEKTNFGLFTDSAPDRWGRVLMQRKEAMVAREENRKPRTLLESDYLLGVADASRMGGLRFKLDESGPFVDSSVRAIPHFTYIRTLEEASLQFEQSDEADQKMDQWLRLLVGPGSSLGGARPKASVQGPDGDLWIAKFPSRNDDHDIGAWEHVVNELALKSGLRAAHGVAMKFTEKHHTYMTKRFDRGVAGRRLHFASAMTLLGMTDGANAASGASYLQIAEFIMRHGANPHSDLEELWQRIVFNICISNSDDHLRNHGFLLSPKGWILSPAYDMNPVPGATGLTLNISEHDNQMNLDLARGVAAPFRVGEERREEIIALVLKAVGEWKEVAAMKKIPRREMDRMADSFLGSE